MQAILKTIATKNIHAKVTVVITNNKAAKGLDIAHHYQVPAKIIEAADFKDNISYEKEIVRYLKEADVDLVVLAGYMRLVGPTILAAYEKRIMNIHPSLLPAFKGLNAQKQALAYGVKVSGCTVHFVDASLDGGPIILQQSILVQENDTEESLSARILNEEHQLLPKAIELFALDKLIIKGRQVLIRN
jgi:phosphoribosylglycinamide formyltransferase-1